MSKVIVYAPTGEHVTVLGIANKGQYKPEDKGHGIRLYSIEFVGTHPKSALRYGQAAPYDLYVVEDGKRRPFRGESVYIERDW